MANTLRIINGITRDERLLSGVEGNMQALRIGAQMTRESVADAEFRAWAIKNIFSGVAGHDFRGEILAAYEYARDRLTYRRDPIGFEKI